MTKLIVLLFICGIVLLGCLDGCAVTPEKLMTAGAYMQSLSPPPPAGPLLIQCVNCR